MKKFLDGVTSVIYFLGIAAVVWALIWYLILVIDLDKKLTAEEERLALISEPAPEINKNLINKNQRFDLSALEGWCRGADEGAIRMLGAWPSTDTHTVEDEQGNTWNITEEVDAEDYLLLWIADNHTPNDLTDDIIVKVWREAYSNN